MKTIIAGSRDMTPTLEDVRTLNKFLASISEVVSGTARGADTFGENWAKAHKIPLKKFPAEWKKYGRAAGPIRNKQMVEYSDQLIAFIYPNSRGTANMINQAKKLGLKVHIIEKEGL